MEINAMDLLNSLDSVEPTAEKRILDEYPTLYSGLAKAVQMRTERPLPEIIKYILLNAEELDNWCVEFHIGTKPGLNEYRMYWIKHRLLGLDVTRNCMHIYPDIWIFGGGGYVEHVKFIEDALATIISYGLLADEYMTYNLFNKKLNTIKKLMNDGIYTIDDLAKKAGGDGGYKHMLYVMAIKFNLDGYSEVLGNDVYLAVRNPDFRWTKKGNFSEIMVEVTTKSHATLAELRENLPLAKKMVIRKLKLCPTIKNNPELLKHLQFTRVNYINGGAIFTISWKESFAYDEIELKVWE